MDEDPFSFIAGADMAVLDASIAFRLCLIALHKGHILDDYSCTVSEGNQGCSGLVR